MKYYLMSLALLAVPGAASAENVVINFNGTFGSNAYGQYRPGDTFSGQLSFVRKREYLQYSPDNPYIQIRPDGFTSIGISFQTSLESFSADNPYVSFTPRTSTLGLFGGRSIPIFSAAFYNIKNNRDYLPTFDQLKGHKGTFSFDTITPQDQEEGDHSGGTGSISFDGTIAQPVPEPATWASMFAGLALAGGVAKYRRRKTKVAFA